MAQRKKWEVELYERENGRCPTKEFMAGLSRQDAVRVERALSRLEEHGTGLGRPHAAPLRDKIWELRVRTHHGRYRLLYFFFEGDRFVITHGIQKDTPAVPGHEIERAIEYRADYLKRRGKERGG